MSKPTEAGAAAAHPFVHRRQITWGDTDTARIAYTARYLDFAMEAVEAWFRDRLGTDWYRLNVERAVGTPFVHVALDFRSPLTPRDALDTTVRLVRLGGSSLRFALAGRAGERLAFEAALVCAFVDTTAMRPIPAPDDFRPALEREAALAAVSR